MVAVKWMIGLLCGIAAIVASGAAGGDGSTRGELRPNGALGCLRCHNYAPVNFILQAESG